MVDIVRAAAVTALLSCAAMVSTSAVAEDYMVDGHDIIMALGLGETADGKSKDMLLLEMEGNTINVTNAFIFATQTEGTNFFVAMGDNVPRLMCVQKSKEKRLSAMQTVEAIGAYNIVGTWEKYTDGIIFLQECDFEYIPQRTIGKRCTSEISRCTTLIYNGNFTSVLVQALSRIVLST